MEIERIKNVKEHENIREDQNMIECTRMRKDMREYERIRQSI